MSSRIRSDLPFVFVNCAITADGKLATADRGISSFSSKRDKEHMMELRATADAVMAGARTVDLCPVTLGPGGEKYRRRRLKHGFAEYNLRIVASGSATLDPRAKIFATHYSPIIVLTTERAPKSRVKRLREVADVVRICGEKEIDFVETFRWLRQEWKVRRLLCEGGGEINDGLFRAGLVDELHLVICPKIFGGQEAPTVADGLGFPKLAEACPMQLRSSRRIGEELFLVYRSSGKR